jgi:hypothetical protein
MRVPVVDVGGTHLSPTTYDRRGNIKKREELPAGG